VSLVALVIATKLLDIGQGPRRILIRAADSVSEQLAVTDTLVKENSDRE